MGHGENLVGNKEERSLTKSLPNSWMMVDLKQVGKMRVTHYCLRDGISSQNYKLRHWCFQGSNNDSDWTTLKTHSDDTTLMDPYQKAGWLVNSSSYFRYFRILQTGKNSYGKDQLVCCGLELY